MCGRYVRISPNELIADEFDVRRTASLEVKPSYNIAPSEPVLVLVNEGGQRQLRTCSWGFVPAWSKDASAGRRMINARAETVAVKPSFRDAFRKSRCLIIADGFYEWQRTAGTKIPFYIHLASGRPFGFAGLYSVWKSSGGEDVCTCAIITTVANDLLSAVHDRMPVIIPKDRESLYLDSHAQDEALLGLLNPYPSAEMACHAVSRRINTPGYDEPDAIKPAR